MSAPTSGSFGSSSPSPVPGYYPDPSIPNYIRYWNGSAWVPGTSRPAPAAGEQAGPPPSYVPVRPSQVPARMPQQQAPPPAPVRPHLPGPVRAAGPSMDESGPMFLDEDPQAPVAEGPGPVRMPAPAPLPSAPAPLPPAAPAPPSPPPAVPLSAPFWPSAQPEPALPRISWGAVPDQQEPPPVRVPAPAPVPPPLAPEQPLRQPVSRPRLQPPPPHAKPWASQVRELTRHAAGNPFAGAAARERPGGLARRFAARVIDTVLLAAVTAPAAVPLGSAAYHHVRDKVDAAKQTGETVTVWLIDGTTGTQLGAVLVVLLAAGLLLEVLPTAKWGRTPGKKLVGLRVLDVEAQLPPGLGPSLRRWLTRTVLDVLVVGLVGAAWCLFDRPWRQCWHDKAARTFVASA